MNAAQLTGIRQMHEDTTSVLKHKPMTTREMALSDHRLSRDGMMAIMPNGQKWVWDTRFEHWVRWM